MWGLQGTRRLTLLAFRRDRIKLPVWILALAGFVWVNIPAITSLYAQNAAERITYATTTAASLISRIFGGPINGPDIGEIINNETFLFAAIAIAFMSTLTVIRHTRQNEETGRAELLASGVTGRHALLVSALLVAVSANIILSGLLVVAFLANGLPVAGSIGTAAALGAIGVCFGAIAAVTAQISDSARGANGLAAAIIGVAFLLRAIGDGIGTVTGGMSVTSAWPSWLSPFGWGQQLHAFTDAHWWIFGLLGICFVGATATAFYLNAIRDGGLGIIPARKGPARAPGALLSTFGLTRRLQRGTLVGWSAGVLVMGLSMGLVSKEFSGLLDDNPELQAYLEDMGGGGSLEDIFFGAILSLTAIAIGGYVVQALQRLRSEETNGTLEPVLATRVSRQKWMISHLLYASLGGILLLALFGASSAVTYVLASGVAWGEVGAITRAALTQIPAILVLTSVTAVLFALFPRFVVPASWAVFAFCLLIGQFGRSLDLPQILINLSPFSHIPVVISQPLSYAPLLILSGIALALSTYAVVWFRHRDLATA